MKYLYLILLLFISNSAYSEIKIEEENSNILFSNSDKNTITPIIPPGITVQDFIFKTVDLNVNEDSPIITSLIRRISNECNGINGHQPLVILGYIGPNSPEFTHNLPLINESNPVVINPGEQYLFRVSFSPKRAGEYLDSIVFITSENLSECDKVCIISGTATLPAIASHSYNFGKVRISYPKQPDNVYQPIDSELITVYNTSSYPLGGILRIEDIEFEGIKGPEESNNGLSAFSFEDNFSSVIPEVPDNSFRSMAILPFTKSLQYKVYFKPTKVGEYEINYNFRSNAEVFGEENKYVIKGHGIVPNIYLFADENGKEETDLVDYGTLNYEENESNSKIFRIANIPNDFENGDVLTIDSIDWGERTTTNIAEIGKLNKEFYIDVSNFMFPIHLDISEVIEFTITYLPNNNDTEHRSIIQIYSDGDDSGLSGKYNSSIVLIGNSEKSNVKRKIGESNFFPNPASNKISFSSKINGIVELYNLLGEKEVEFDTTNGQTFDVSKLSNGVYIIKYKIDNQYFSEKLSVYK